MLTDESREFLKKPLIARMATIDEVGYPHVVPIWFDLDGDDFMVIAVRSTRKVAHIQQNAKGGLTVGGAPGDGGGYAFKGQFRVEEDRGQTWTKRMIYRYETEPTQAEKFVEEWATLDMIVIRLTVEKVLKV